ncbi:TonB-dependent receptor P3 [Dyadobacter sp. CECT 9275]|uniref:TonB-dependent receptor P3 n=1 Tax=Dyadobacter helix TaxID=2822344 RepID=A0A916NB30_9BACT|nr:SusC/RagA family TonB-linked outer membrane protein [Dyadobacter sp. CECT 9275]CAG4994384.1 TonB-dependent receptor P3 [Dyadobacter sp. CECT 9275]
MRKQTFTKRSGSCVGHWKSLGFLLISVLCTGRSTAVGSGKMQSIEDVKISLHLHNVTLQNAFIAIEKKSDFKFITSIERIHRKKRVSVSLEKRPVKEVLELILNGTGLGYTQVNNNIIISSKPASGATGQAPQPVSVPSAAQQHITREINGTVKDATGSAVPGTNIVIKGINRGTSTDGNGNFTMAIPDDNAVLIFSSIGYTTREIAVENRHVVDVVLNEDVKQLGEVVVTALGIERNAKTLTYATQQIDGKQLTDVRDPNFVNTLSGKIAGIGITQSSSGPGSATRVILRGNRSITGNNNALFVIDGVPVDNTVRSQVTGDFGGINGSDGANNFNPDDIESLNILKGPAASALYGSRAANGVIMITTKKGKAGKISADINSGVSVETPFLLPRLQNQFGQGAGGISSSNSPYSWGAEATTYPDNIRDFFRDAVATNNSIGISAGTDKVQSYLSYTNNYNQGILPNNQLMRHSMNLRLNTQISKRFSTDAKVTYTNQSIENKPRSGEESSVTMNLYKVPRSVDLNNVYNTYQDENGQPTYWTSSSIYMNPYWTLNKTFASEKRNRVIVLGSARYNLTDWLNVQGRISYDWYADRYNFGYAAGTLLFAGTGGSFSDYTGEQLERNMDLILSGHNNIGNDLTVTYNFGAGSTYNRFSQVGASTTGLSVPNRFDLSFASALTQITGFSEKKLQYVFGTASVSLRDFITLDASIRNDWSSTLPKPYSYIYSSFGANAILSEAFELPSWISFLKLRGSWAQVGNDASPYSLSQTYNFSQGGTGGFISRNTTKPAENLKPEISSSTEFGLDLRMFGRRLGIDFTYYNSNTVNQLLTLNLARPTGFTSQYVNAGKINNHGFELTLSASPLRGRKFTWDASLNFARNVNKVIKLHPSIKTATLGGNTRTTTAIVREGKSYGDLQAYGWKTDANGHYVVNSKGLPVQTSFDNIVGNFNPKFTFGFTNTFAYKKFTLTFLIDGRVGGTMVSGTDGNLAYDGTAKYTQENREGGWILPAVVETDDGVVTSEQNTVPITAETFWQTVSQGRYTWGGFFAYNTTNVRLRELSLGYNIPTPACLFIKNARLSLTARNLFFFYRGSARMDIPGLKKRKLPFDPDVNLGSANYQGAEYGTLPSTRTVGLNLKLGF